MSRQYLPYDILIRFAAGEFDEPRVAGVESHLTACEECATTIARYREVQQVIREDRTVAPSIATLDRAKGLFARFGPRPAPASPGMVETLRRVVARLTFDSREGYALAGLRGAASGYQVSYESDEADVDVRVEPVSGLSAGRWQLLGQIDVWNSGHGGEMHGKSIPVTLASPGADDPVVKVEADEHGFFTIRTEPGRFDLHVQLSRDLLVLPNLEVG